MKLQTSPMSPPALAIGRAAWIIKRRARHAIYNLFTSIKKAAPEIGMISSPECGTWAYKVLSGVPGSGDFASLDDIRGWLPNRRFLRLRRSDGFSPP